MANKKIPDLRMRVRIRDESLRLEMLSMKPKQRAEYIERAIFFYKQMNDGSIAKDIAQLITGELKKNGVAVKPETVSNPVTGFMKKFGV